MSHRILLGIVVALAVALATVPLAARAGTRSDYMVVCLDLSLSDPGFQLYPYSSNSSFGTRPVGGGSFSWDLFSEGRMPGAGIPYLTQGADAWAGYENATIPFGAGCQFFSGNQSQIGIVGRYLGAPQMTGTAPAQISVHYHVILETEFLGSGASIGATNGVQIDAPQQFGSANLSLTGSGGTPVLDVPQGAMVTDVSIGNLTRKEVEGVVVVNDMLSYGIGVVNRVDITFFAGSQASVSDSPVAVTGESGSMGSQTATTEVVSLDPNVVFTVLPEPGASVLGAVAFAGLGVLSRRRGRRS